MTIDFDTRSQRNGFYAMRRREALVLKLSEVHLETMRAAALEAGLPPPRELSLGYGRCACCERDLTPDLLEIDHVHGRLWELGHLNRWARVAKYWREFEAGVALRALCRSCNARLGSQRRYPRRRR